jgi:hypothetical protein
MTEPLAYEGGLGATDFHTRFGTKIAARFQDAHVIEAQPNQSTRLDGNQHLCLMAFELASTP